MELVILAADLRQPLPEFLQLLVQGTEGFLILSLLIQQVRVVFTNSGDDSFLRSTTVLKGLEVHQGLKRKHIRQSKVYQSKIKLV